MPDAFDKLQEVSANETITAEAWNHLIDAIQALYKELDALESQRPGWIVVGVRAEDGAEPGRELQGGEINMVTANAPADVSKTTIGSRVRGRYVIANLSPGLYDVRVAPTMASGFAAAVQRNVQVQPGGAAVVDVVVGRAALAGMLPVVPDLFRQGLQEALRRLAERRLALGKVLDTHGQEIAVTTTIDQATGTITYTAPPDYASRPVVGSEPGEGMEVPPAAAVSLLIAASTSTQPA